MRTSNPGHCLLAGIARPERARRLAETLLSDASFAGWGIRAAGAVYLLVAACLGLRIDASERRLSFARAVLPDTLEWLRIANLSIAGSRVDLLLTRHPHDVGVRVLRREGELRIICDL